MGTTIEYSSKLATGDMITFYLEGKKFLGKVAHSPGYGYWIDCGDNATSHNETVERIFSYFGISNRHEFRNQVVGREYSECNSVWPYTSSLEELKKMLDQL